MVHDDPVVEVVQGEAQWEDNDGKFVQPPGGVENHADLVPQIWSLTVDIVIILIKLQSDDGEDDGILKDGAEYHEDAGHQVGVDGIELGQSGWGGVGPDTVEDVHEDEEEDDEQRHPARDDLKCDDMMPQTAVSLLPLGRWWSLSRRRGQIGSRGCKPKTC